MNKTLLAFLICFVGFQTAILQAQEFQIGLKGGINKTFGGEITGIASTSGYTSDTFNAKGEIGFHGGIWTQLNFGKFFIRPEIVYSSLESRFNVPTPSGVAIYNVEELSVPLLVGYNIFGSIDIYGGMAYKNIVSSEISGRKPLFIPPENFLRPIENPSLPLSGQIGVKVEYGSFGLDIRYDHSLASKEPQPTDFISGGGGNTADPRLNRAILDDGRLN